MVNEAKIAIFRTLQISDYGLRNLRVFKATEKKHATTITQFENLLQKILQIYQYNDAAMTTAPRLVSFGL